MKNNFLHFILIISSLANGIVYLDQNRKLDQVNEDSPSRSAQISASSSCTSSSSLNPSYHNGGTVTGTVNLYHIYIGYSDSDYKLPYTSNKQTSTSGILEAFASSVSGSTFTSILASYNITTQFVFKNNSFYNVPQSEISLTDSSVANYVANAIQKAGWNRNDTSAMYVVIFRGDISYKSTKNDNLSWNSEWYVFNYLLTILKT